MTYMEFFWLLLGMVCGGGAVIYMWFLEKVSETNNDLSHGNVTDHSNENLYIR
jgi:hypothetical protein